MARLNLESIRALGLFVFMKGACGKAVFVPYTPYFMELNVKGKHSSCIYVSIKIDSADWDNMQLQNHDK